MSLEFQGDVWAADTTVIIVYVVFKTVILNEVTRKWVYIKESLKICFLGAPLGHVCAYS